MFFRGICPYKLGRYENIEINLEAYIAEYGAPIGYLVLFLGSLIEGESVVLTAGFLCFKGYLSFPLAVLIAFFGSVSADQLLFFLGRLYGPSILRKKPSWQEKTDKVFDLLHRYNVWFIVGFRFVYGIRTISPFVIGASGIDIKRFAILNIIAGMIWAFLSVGAGYLIGYFFSDVIDTIIEKFIQYQKIGITSIILIIVVFIFGKRWRQKKGTR